ncbi:hypothetical protein [Alloyangia pacifica]|uniref:hypothetical protein n=1 Tax=Alloyangia pacifica TaxID=311180 RepID=UPI001CD1CB86|nr:hypothetical protein [Alloyangia pacifica]MCA0997159.1 hypothetical protein [Alloyangia pacifica]
MRKRMALIAVMAALALPAGAATTEAEQTYALLFKEGTLDDVSRASVLRYTRAVSNSAKPEAAERDSGQIALSIDESGAAPLANLQFEQGGKHRNLGSFPASVGNPMIMYFYETVIRDMAETAGGSPYYIRNRVKEALVEPAQIDMGEASFDGATVPTRTITLRPFADDPNAGRMQGFGDLELRVTMSEAVPGWYLSFTAEAPDGEGAAGGYRSELRFAGTMVE